MADSVKVQIHERNGTELGFPEELDLTPGNVPIVPTGKPFRATDLEELALELRQKIIYDPEYRTSTLNGTLQLMNTDKTLQIINGSATGYSVQLPDATTLKLGEKFENVNLTGEQILVKDYTGTTLLILNPSDIVTSTVEDNTTGAGNWFQITTSSTAQGITSYTLDTNTLFSTTSSTDDPITGFSITPVSGRYSVWYSSDIKITNNNRVSQCVLFKDGIEDNTTRRDVQGVGNNFFSNHQTLGIITVNGSQAIDVRVNITAGTLETLGRTLVLIRLGA